MPLHVPMKGKHIKTKRLSNGLVVGGAVPLLLNSVVRIPEIKGGSIGANRIVGIKSSTLPISPVLLNAPSVGGELLNSISFGKSVKHNNRENIKFLF